MLAYRLRASALEAFRTICSSRDAETVQLIEAFETEVCPDRSRTEQPTDMARVKELVAGLQRVEAAAAARKENK
jgi:urocanate hydratase